MHSYELLNPELSPVDTFTSEDYSAKSHAIRSAISQSESTRSLFLVRNTLTLFTWMVRNGRVTVLGIPKQQGQ